jgi:hypothetical protein
MTQFSKYIFIFVDNIFAMFLYWFVYRIYCINMMTIVTITAISSPTILVGLYSDNVAVAQTQTSSDTHSHLSGFFYNPIDPYHSIFPIRNVEKSPLLDKAGDALSTFGHPAQPNLKILSHEMTADGNCEMCQFIKYTPGQIGKAGVAYKSAETLNLDGALRVVFFARGAQGGEKIAFVALGKPFDTSTSPLNIFKDIKFSVISKNITLTSQWARYQVSLNGSDMTNVIDPFGFIVYKVRDHTEAATIPSSSLGNRNITPIAFFLTGVTFDSNPAVNPIPSLQLSQANPGKS